MWLKGQRIVKIFYFLYIIIIVNNLIVKGEGLNHGHLNSREVEL